MKIPFFGNKPKPQEPVQAAVSQTRDSWNDPMFKNMNGYLALRGDLNLYDAMRATLPILDVAVSKRAQLIGDFEIHADDKRTQEFLEWYLGQVKVGWFGRGFSSWLRQIIDSTIAKGFGVGELVPDVFMRGVDRLKVGRANEFRFAENEITKRLELVQVIEGQVKPVKMENQDLIYYSAFDVRDGHPQGISMLASLPFVSEILARINKAVDNTIWRIGDPTIVGIYKAGARDTKESVAAAVGSYVSDLTEAMKSRRLGKVVDLAFGVPNDGDFKISILGGDAELPDITVPMKSVMEQIIARTGLPPYMFGLSWSTTERMSKEQSDMLVSEIWSQRELLDPIIEKNLNTALILYGFAGAKWEHEWYDVNLTDENLQAQATLNNAQALNAEVTAMMQLYNAGVDVSEAIVNLAERAGWIEEGAEMSIEARIEEVRSHINTQRKIALARVSIE